MAAEPASRQAITDALATLIGAAVPGADIRGFTGQPGKPERLGEQGAVVLIGVDGPEPAVDLSPLTYHHETEFELAVMATTIEKAQAMLAALGLGVVADRTLGGACEWLDASVPGLDEETMTGSDGHTEARCAIIASYSTTNPLG